MSLRVEFQLDGLRQTKRVFRELNKRGRDTAPLADAIGQTLTASAERRLTTTNVDPDGTPWPVSARVRARGGKTQTNRGHLAASLTHAVGADGGSVTVGSNKPYAAMRQFGGTIRPKKPGGVLIFTTFDEKGQEVKVAAKKVTQPARPYLGVSDEDADEMAGLALDYLNDAFDEAVR